MKKIWAPGELLIDFFSKDGEHFTKKMGGAPANVCVGVHRLGGRAAMMGSVGDDAFGKFLKEFMVKEGIDCDYLSLEAGLNTTLAFVSNDEAGERSFSFHRGADEKWKLPPGELKDFENQDILHLGSATALLGGELLASVLRLKEHALKNKWLLVVDPNYREGLYKARKKQFIDDALALMRQADLVKVSDDELKLLTDTEDLLEGAKGLLALDIRSVLVTCGSKGLIYVTHNYDLSVPAIRVSIADTTGAGDAVMASVLQSLSEYEDPKSVLDDASMMEEILKRGRIVAGLTCTAFGAVEAFPTVKEIEEFERNYHAK